MKSVIIGLSVFARQLFQISTASVTTPRLNINNIYFVPSLHCSSYRNSSVKEELRNGHPGIGFEPDTDRRPTYCIKLFGILLFTTRTHQHYQNAQQNLTLLSFDHNIAAVRFAVIIYFPLKLRHSFFLNKTKHKGFCYNKLFYNSQIANLQLLKNHHQDKQIRTGMFDMYRAVK